MHSLCVYGIIAQHETERLSVFTDIISNFEQHRIVDAVYPTLRKVPWQNEMLDSGMSKCNRRLSQGELGCLLSHRKAWKLFLNSKHTSALILESDSTIPDISDVIRIIENYRDEFDILFLGSYHRRTKLRRSTSKLLENGHRIGVPLENTLYCAYGYLINKSAARHLLLKTGKILWPVDYWSKWLMSDNRDYVIRTGAVVPEVISSWAAPSTIQDINAVQTNEKLPRKVRYFIGEVYNSIVGYFK